MSARVVLDGMDDLKQALRNLPVHLKDESMSIVHETTDGAATEVRSKYQQHRRSGNLAEHVKTEYPSTTIAVGIVKSTAKHADLFEWGSQLRKTLRGWDRGRMPPAGTNGAVPIFQRWRRRMNERLIAMVKREGFEVTGG